MYGIMVQVVVDTAREDQAKTILVNNVVPEARARRGFVAGYWLRALEGNVLRAVQIYETEKDAREAAEHIQSQGPPPGAPVTLQSVEVFAVIASA